MIRRAALLAVPVAVLLVACSKPSHAFDAGTFTLAVPGDWTYASTPPAVMMTAPRAKFQCMYASRDTGSDLPPDRDWDALAERLKAVSSSPVSRKVAGLPMKGVTLAYEGGTQSLLALIGKRGTVEYTVMITDSAVDDGDDFTDVCLEAIHIPSPSGRGPG